VSEGRERGWGLLRGMSVPFEPRRGEGQMGGERRGDR
jgi:hypothetical protein